MESWLRDDNHQDGSIPSHDDQVNCEEKHEEQRLQFLDVCHSEEKKFSDRCLIGHHLKAKTEEYMECYLCWKLESSG